ncbi:hypothetical protein GCM10027395_15440 [Giesbergeria sinuosa]
MSGNNWCKSTSGVNQATKAAWRAGSAQVTLEDKATAGVQAGGEEGWLMAGRILQTRPPLAPAKEVSNARL